MLSPMAFNLLSASLLSTVSLVSLACILLVGFRWPDQITGVSATMHVELEIAA